MAELFKSLDRIEGLLKSSGDPYVFGEEMTEIDTILFPSIIRFNVAYYTLFKTDLEMIRHDYPYIHKWLQHLYWDLLAFGDSTNFEHIKRVCFLAATLLVRISD
jgi:putative glutathione S-transferase